MVNDWKTGIKPKGNCILFKWVGVWVNQVQVKRVLLTVHLFLLFLGFLFKTFAIMCSTNWLKQCFNVSRWVAPKYENVETMPETVNFNDHAYTSVFYNTITSQCLKLLTLMTMLTPVYFTTQYSTITSHEFSIAFHILTMRKYLMIEPFHCTFKILKSDWFIALHSCFHYYLVTFFSPSEYGF